MLLKSKIEMSSSRSFGIVFFIVFIIISLWPLTYDSQIRVWSMFIAIVFLILGLINSKLLTPLNRIWFKFGILLGALVAPIVMGIVFFLVVTPTGILMKLLRKDLINLKKNNKKTYWIEKKELTSNMKNQF